MKLNPDQVKRFQEYLTTWQQKLNLQSWRIEVAKKRTSRNVYARMSVSAQDRLATCSIGSGWITGSDFELEQTVVHELMHISLAEFALVVKTGNDELILGAEHSLITVLERLLVKLQ